MNCRLYQAKMFHIVGVNELITEIAYYTFAPARIAFHLIAADWAKCSVISSALFLERPFIKQCTLHDLYAAKLAFLCKVAFRIVVSVLIEKVIEIFENFCILVEHLCYLVLIVAED